MLRGNLASRPFYNDRLVGLVLAIVGVVALGLTAFNATRLLSLSAQRSALQAQIDRDKSEAVRIRGQADALKKSVDQSTLKLLVGSTREANTLIDQRTFSWTTVLGLVEKTLPLDVRLRGIEPKVDRGEMKVVMAVTAKRHDDLDRFYEALYETGTFYDVTPQTDELNDDGTYTVIVEASYQPPAIVEKAPAAPIKSGEKGRRP
jgi:hypothetical protein